MLVTLPKPMVLLRGLSVALLLVPAIQAADTPLQIGVAQVDITPDYPIRLSGFGGRRAESDGVTMKIWAKALAFDGGQNGPAILITVDNLGVPDYLVRQVAEELGKRVGLRRERLTITATHTHTAPMLRDVCPTLFGVPIPSDHQEHIKRYTGELSEKLVRLSERAVQDLQPSRMGWGVGKVGFARNRRTAGGPVDHDLPVLVVQDLRGKERAIYFSYACHCVTLSHNKISGDWAGYAQDQVQRDHPGAVALASVGCGADSDPDSGVRGDKVEIAAQQGEQIASEIKRLLSAQLAWVTNAPITRLTRIELPLDELPTRAQWEERAKLTDAVGYHARVQLARLDRGEPLQTKIDYPVQTWAFGHQLALVFLAGEVVVDYSRRLKRELDNTRLWVNGYANDAPCYIPSERVLKEGGYEGGAAMIYYDRPTRFKAGLEDKIIGVVHEHLAPTFKARDATANSGNHAPEAPSVSSLVQQILDDTKPAAEREALIHAQTSLAGALIAEMAQGLKPGDLEEYRRIPWIWRVAIRAGQQNQTEQLLPILEAALPKSEEPLRDWQAVVLGGGIINGLSQLNLWPGDRLREILDGKSDLNKRWQRALELAAVMADDPDVPAGTRYDALRLLGVEPWEKRGEQLAGYLDRRANEELQMGAISGLSDMKSPQVPAALLSGIAHYSLPNRQLALEALLRDDTRIAALLEAVAAGRVSPPQLGEKRTQTLKTAANPQLRERAQKLLAK